jgi:3-hydroxybutyryl-CoA dehydrogenase
MLGVIGAGKMGIQLTKLLSETEKVVVVARDIDKAKFAFTARYPGWEKIIHDKVNSQRIVFTNSFDDLNECKVIFECLPEIFDLKVNLINQISKLVSSPIASCTSTISLGKLRPHLVSPDRLHIIHFSNPISATKIAEVVFAENINDREKNILLELLVQLGVDYVEVPDIDGFVVNSLLFPLLYKSVRLHIDFGTSKADVDKLMKQACKFPMGPFEIIRLVGIDTVVAVFQNLNLEVDSKFVAALKN